MNNNTLIELSDIVSVYFNHQDNSHPTDQLPHMQAQKGSVLANDSLFLKSELRTRKN